MSIARTLAAAAAAFALSATPALAQTTTGPTELAPPDTIPGITSPAGAVPEPLGEPAPTPLEGQVMSKSDSELMVSEIMEASVVIGQGEQIARVNDLLTTQDGDIKAIVIGVGGWLGLGEKEVAFDIEKFTVERPNAGAVTLYLNVAAPLVRDAPAFNATGTAGTALN